MYCVHHSHPESGAHAERAELGQSGHGSQQNVLQGNNPVCHSDCYRDCRRYRRCVQKLHALNVNPKKFDKSNPHITSVRRVRISPIFFELLIVK